MTRTTSTRLKKLETAATIYQLQRQPRSTSLSDWYSRLDQIDRSMFYTPGVTAQDIKQALGGVTA